VNGQVLHSATKDQLDVVAGMDQFAKDNILPILKPSGKCWQPQDFLPAPESPDFLDHVRPCLPHLPLNRCMSLAVTVGRRLPWQAAPL
jgi:acyl-[acyl-carrier-protein] desaturase